MASPQGPASLQENAGWCTRNRKWTMTILTPWVSRGNVAGLSSRTSASGCGGLAFLEFQCEVHRCQGVEPESQWIGLREIFNRKAPYSMGKSMVSCKIPLNQSNQWIREQMPRFHNQRSLVGLTSCLGACQIAWWLPLVVTEETWYTKPGPYHTETYPSVQVPPKLTVMTYYPLVT